ncbi:MAG: hypothetical protein IT233_11200 [Bacteroidia bacterium]|nr:hypothetical protein [Bacteroidia bacterium]
MLKGFKNKVGRYILRQELQNLPRQRAFLNLDESKTIGILFSFTTPEEFDLLKKYVGYLKDHKKKVKAFGYVDADTEPPGLSYSKVEFEFFTRKDLNWYGRPTNVYTQNFMDEERDVLIDLNLTDVVPLKFMAAKANSKFKIGKLSNENKKYYDMLIEYDKTKTFKFFLAQVDTYLLMINKKENSVQK